MAAVKETEDKSIPQNAPRESTVQSSVDQCTKCLVKLDANNCVTVRGMGGYGVVNELIPDANCPGGGTHDMRPIQLPKDCYRRVDVIGIFQKKEEMDIPGGKTAIPNHSVRFAVYDKKLQKYVFADFDLRKLKGDQIELYPNQTLYDFIRGFYMTFNAEILIQHQITIMTAKTQIIDVKHLEPGQCYYVSFSMDMHNLFSAQSHSSSIDSLSKEKQITSTSANYAHKTSMIQFQRMYGAQFTPYSDHLTKLISETPDCFVYLNQLKSAWKNRDLKCIVSGSEDVTLSHIIPKSGVNWLSSLKCLNAKCFSRPWLSPHDLRCVLPLKRELHEEFDSFKWSIVSELPLGVLEDVDSKQDDKLDDNEIWRVFVFEQRSYLDKKKLHISAYDKKEVTQYIKDNKIFRRVLFAHYLYACKYRQQTPQHFSLGSINLDQMSIKTGEMDAEQSDGTYLQQLLDDLDTMK
eukprot:187599_1